MAAETTLNAGRLFNSGTLSYNGVSWVSLFKSKISCKPVKDSAGRALTVRQYTLDVEGVVATQVGGTTDGLLGQLRKLLMAPAGPLVVQLKGYGLLQVNVPGFATWDAGYGPWPEILDWIPLGNDQSCLVKWRCTTLVPCEESPSQKGIIEWCWEEDWDIDEDAYTRRTISGHVTVEATRATPSTRTIPDNADAYREKVVPKPMPGFQRKQQFHLSEDKRTLQYHIEDQQIPYALPNGVSRADVHQRAKWVLRNNAAVIMGSLSGTITLPAKQPKTNIRDVIMLIVNSRVSKKNAAQAAKTSLPALAALKIPRSDKDGLLIIESFEVDDELFGRSTSFSINYTIYGVGLEVLLSATGMWLEVDGTSFQGSLNSLKNNALAPRGAEGLYFKNSDDAIVDLCNKTPPVQLQAGPSPSTRKVNGALTPPFNGSMPFKAASSWIAYKLRVRLVENDRIARHKPLKQKSAPRPVEGPLGFITEVPSSPGLKPPQPGEIGGLLDPADKAVGEPGAGVTSSTPDILQRVSAPTFTVVLEGYAIRAGYRVPIPRLDSVGGVPATQLGQVVSEEKVSSVGGIPFYYTSWRIVYALPDDPQDGLPVGDNPALA